MSDNINEIHAIWEKLEALEKKFENVKLSVDDNNDWIIDNDVLKEVLLTFIKLQKALAPKSKCESDVLGDQYDLLVRCLGETEKLPEFSEYDKKIMRAMIPKADEIIHDDPKPSMICGDGPEPKPKSEPEKDYVGFVRNYEGYWKSEYDKLILEFLEDLTGCWTWINGKERKAKSITIKQIEEKWQGRLK